MAYPQIFGDLYIRPNDKFALIAAKTKVEDLGTAPVQVDDDLWVSNFSIVEYSDFWKEQLGSIRDQRLRQANLIVLARRASKSPEILDHENQVLGDRIRRYFTGLILSSRFPCPDFPPIWLTGANVDGVPNVRQITELYGMPWQLGVFRENLTRQQINDAVEQAHAMTDMSSTGHFRRLFRIIQIYSQARILSESLDQIHQYSRCIEGLIIPAPGESGAKFKSRTEIFIGPRHHALMGELYDIRSAVEHLNDHLFVIPAGREERIEIVRKAIIAEYIARNCISRILSRRNLWDHFKTDIALKSFWTRGDIDKVELWGSPIDPLAALQGFDPASISDSRLGLP